MPAGSRSVKQGRSSFSLNGARKGWQLCCCLTASDSREAGAAAERQVLQHACPRYSEQEYRHSTYWTGHMVVPNTPLDIMSILNRIVAPVVLRLKSSQPSEQACPSNLQSQNKSMWGEQSRWKLGSSSSMLIYNSVIYFLFKCFRMSGLLLQANTGMNLQKF